MRSTKNTIRLLNLFCCFTMLSSLLGCASVQSSFLHGGTLAPAGYKVEKVIVAYRAEGTVPARMQYFLIETGEGLAIFEREEDGSGSLIQTHWQDKQGDHFAAWVSVPGIPSAGCLTDLTTLPSRKGRGGPAYEFVVPIDRSKEAERFVYERGTYTIWELDGISRPVPKNPETKAVATLIPK
jgi:hypothetical protein